MSVKRIKVENLELVAHCHATEDVEKVKRALMNLIPPDVRPRAMISEQRLSGYFHNPITRISVVVLKEDALTTLKYIISRMEPHDRNYLLLSLEQRYDRKSNKLFFRVDKKEAFMGNVVLSDGSDTIRVAVSFSLARSLREVEALIRSLASGEGNEDRSTNPSQDTG